MRERDRDASLPRKSCLLGVHRTCDELSEVLRRAGLRPEDAQLRSSFDDVRHIFVVIAAEHAASGRTAEWASGG